MRTFVDLAGGAIVAYLVGNIPTFDAITQQPYWWGLAMAVGTAVTAGAKRKVWPMTTDQAGVGRADLPPPSPGPAGPAEL